MVLSESTSKTLDFLYASIADVQATIRGIDVKAGFLFVVLFSPIYEFSQTDKVLKAIGSNGGLFVCLVLFDGLVWLASIITLLMAVATISNADRHIDGNPPPGTFYSGNLYDVRPWDALVGRRRRSSRTFEQEISALPSNEEKIIDELVFERMKLCYIRAIKVKRFTYCVYSTVAWIGLSGIICLVFGR